MRKNLTRRQQQFLSQFLDIFRECGGLIHYADIAERLGIGRVTAYEMLRLLEERGLVQSDFHLPEDKHSPGRAIVLFSPTVKAEQLVQELVGETPDNEDWKEIKNHIMEQLRQGKTARYNALLNDLLVRVPERDGSLIYMAEMTTALLLTLRTYLEGSRGQEIKEQLGQIGLPGELGLSALAGMGMALGLMEQVNRRTATFLLSESSKYQRIFSELTEDNRRRLGNLAREVFQIIKE